MFFGSLVRAGNLMISLNPATVSETTVQTLSASADLGRAAIRCEERQLLD